jgi:heat shock protein HslJ
MHPSGGGAMTRTAVVAVCLMVASCGGSTSERSDPQPSVTAVDARTWYWLGSVAAGELAPEVSAPQRYTVAFAEGRAVVQADCNRGSGSYELDGQTLRIGAIALTRAACLPPSVGGLYAQQLQAAHRLERYEDVLRLSSDEHSMLLASEPAARLFAYRCQEGVVLIAVTRDDSADVFLRDGHYKLPRTRSASGVQYSDGDVTFHTKGALASVSKGKESLARGCQMPSQ